MGLLERNTKITVDYPRESQTIADNLRQSLSIAFKAFNRQSSYSDSYCRYCRHYGLQVSQNAGLLQDHYPACQTLMHSLFMILNYRKVPFCNLAYIDMGNNNGTPAFFEHPSHLTQ